MAWDKVKSLFITHEPDPSDDAALIAEELEAFAIPRSEPSAPSMEAMTTSGAIDFQALYDQAGIPNTDEVEALERFLDGLDNSLPQASRIAAAKAFLGAIGKAPNDVLTDSARKIGVVRTIEDAKRTDAEAMSAREQTAIDELQAQIEKHRAQMEMLQRELESVRTQCAAEEGRLQGARAFFGVLGNVTAPTTEARKKK